jgi:formylglycine-generating enzyme required for sulfatase activity
MGRFPLLNEEYGRYLKAQKGKVGEPEEWSNSRFNQARQPVVGINWAEAVGTASG